MTEKKIIREMSYLADSNFDNQLMKRFRGAERFVELGRELDNAILPHQKALRAIAYLQKQNDLVISSRDHKEEIYVPMDDIRKILDKSKREHEEEIKRLGEEAFETLLKSRNHI